MGSDRLQDAYHGVPNHQGQLPFCVVVFCDLHANTVRFAVSCGYLFGLVEAGNNFNRLPDLLTVFVRRVGARPSCHYFDDRGALKLRDASLGLTGMHVQEFVQRIYKLVSRQNPS